MIMSMTMVFSSSVNDFLQEQLLLLRSLQQPQSIQLKTIQVVEPSEHGLMFLVPRRRCSTTTSSVFGREVVVKQRKREREMRGGRPNFDLCYLEQKQHGGSFSLSCSFPPTTIAKLIQCPKASKSVVQKSCNFLEPMRRANWVDSYASQLLLYRFSSQINLLKICIFRA